MKPKPLSHFQTGRVVRRLAVALLIVTGTAMGQSAAPVGVAKPAEYDCAGMAGVALTNCRQLNAAAVRGAMTRSDGTSNSSHDCDGMNGAALATCRDLNGQSATTGAEAGGAVNNGYGYGTAATGTGYPGGSTGTQGTQSTAGNPTVPSQGVTTPIQEQTTGGTNPITPSGTGATATTGGTNPITPSGTGTTATTGGTNPIAPSGTGASATTGGSNPIAPSGAGVPAAASTTEDANQSTTPPAGSLPERRMELRRTPGNVPAPPPPDRVVPMTPAAGSSVSGTAGGGTKATR